MKLFQFFPVLLFLSCAAGTGQDVLDANFNNDKSYHYRYVDVDSSFYYANIAEKQSLHYKGGREEAQINKAFVNLLTHPELEIVKIV